MSKRRSTFVAPTFPRAIGFKIAMDGLDAVAEDQSIANRVGVLAATSKRAPRSVEDIARRADLPIRETSVVLSILRSRNLIAPETERGFLRTRSEVSS